jgi:hypothetical protein
VLIITYFDILGSWKYCKFLSNFRAETVGQCDYKLSW